MKLIGGNVSPYVSRCRTLVYARALPVVIANAPADKGPGFEAGSLYGKVPALALDDDCGTVLFESEVISEFLPVIADGVVLLQNQ